MEELDMNYYSRVVRIIQGEWGSEIRKFHNPQRAPYFVSTYLRHGDIFHIRVYKGEIIHRRMGYWMDLPEKETEMLAYFDKSVGIRMFEECVRQIDNWVEKEWPREPSESLKGWGPTLPTG